MARPLKDGAVYFSKDTDFYEDDKIKVLRAEFNARGMYLLDYLLCDLYGKDGYFMKLDSTKCYLLADGARCGITPGFVKEFVQGCIRCSLFDERVFDAFSVLTSRGIQKRYIRMLNSRTQIRIIKDYFLLDPSDPNEIPKGSLDKIVLIGVSDKENPVFLSENYTNKSKVKESKYIPVSEFTMDKNKSYDTSDVEAEIMRRIK